MTFLNPGVLWLLPLAALPWLALLVRRRPDRSLPWGASRFLTASVTVSARWLRLRRTLAAALACGALVCLIVGAARPVVQAGTGWRLGSGPELVVIGLDRSPALEAAMADRQSRRLVLLRALQRQARPLAGHTHYALVDAAHGSVAPADPARLAEHPGAAPLDVPTDIPRLLALALDRIDAETPATAEIWLGTGLEATAWRADQPVWQQLRQRLDRTSGRVTVRWFRAPEGAGGNLSLRRAEVGRDELSGAARARVVVSGRAPGPVTLTVTLGADSRPFAIPAWPGDRVIQDIPLEPGDAPRLGVIRLPDDANPADNVLYIAIPARTARLSLIACTAPENTRVALAAAAPDTADAFQTARCLAPADITPAILAAAALVVLDAVPEGPPGQALQAFVEGGGAVLVLPGAGRDSAAWLGVSRGPAVRVEPSVNARAAESGEALVAGLPLGHVQVRRLGELRGGVGLARSADGRPLFVRSTAGRGTVVWSATALTAEASNLADGVVLLPLVQRLAAAGARRLSAVEYRDCALLPPAVRAACVLPPEPDGDRAAGLKSGILRCRLPGQDAECTVVLERPVACDAPATLAADAPAALIGPPLRLADAAGGAAREATGALLLSALVLLGTALATPGRRRQAP